VVIISACLLGENCRYNGGHNYSEKVARFTEGQNYIAVCPEVAGGLPTPRPPAERRGALVQTAAGADVTAAFREGAGAALAAALRQAELYGETVDLAILKARSPSCGVGCIYDGSFTRTPAPGDGVFAELLKKQGISLMTEEDIIE
jgi:uncharacterized protein YbbK (DUF523 family)